MLLLERLGLTIAGIFAVYATIDFTIQRTLVYPSFEELEAREAREDVERVTAALQAEVEHLDSLCHDWAAWDDTVRFIHEHDEAYVNSTLTESTLENAELAVVLFVARDGRVVERRLGPGLDPARCEAAEFPVERRDPTHPLHTITSPTDQASGFVAAPCGPLLVAARPIVPSDEQGEPCGSLLMARLVDEGRIAHLRTRTRVQFDLVPLDDRGPEAPGRAAALSELLAGETFATRASNEEVRSGWALLRDYRGQPMALLEASLPRGISAEGRRVVDYAQLSLLAAALLVLAVTRLLLKRIVVTPLARVSAHAARIGAGGEFTARLASERTDEIGDLSRALDTMVEQLAESRTRLLRVAHLAGRSEVATEVLHNVGSVLTSTTVAAQEVEARVKASRAADVARLADLLRAHEAELGTFMTSDVRGKKIPEFVGLLGQALASEREAVLAECDVLRQSLDHVRTLVQEQQKNAGHAAVLEPVELAALCDLALRLAPGPQPASLQVERRYEHLEIVSVAKHRLIEILVNLIKNARESIDAARPAEPRLSIELEAIASDRVRIVVRDNGLGIPRESLTRIFAHGFTTKVDGHGFGLHSCANAARELGGSLRAESDGTGTGAAFVLELPVGAARSAAEVVST
ncbi:MAG: HAMP domain-containing protein [Planctomycetes bacterium]|nr:HAMP domain-containing protein [Planctomycetota bacterium]